MSEINKDIYTHPKVAFCHTIPRRDDHGNLDKVWRRQWYRNIFFYLNLSLSTRLFLVFLLPTRRCLRFWKKIITFDFENVML